MKKAAVDTHSRHRVLTEADIRAAAGGSATEEIGSQNTGAGAGRVTFNPFLTVQPIRR